MPIIIDLLKYVVLNRQILLNLYKKKHQTEIKHANKFCALYSEEFSVSARLCNIKSHFPTINHIS